MNAVFSKSEKLCSNIAINQLYQRGKKFVVWPMRISYLPSTGVTSQVLIWAPKALIHNAVDRNKLRRLMREAYRLNKHLLVDSGKCYQLAFNYIDKEVQDFRLINRAMQKTLKRLVILEEK